MGGSGDFFCMPFYDGDTYKVMGQYQFCFSKETLITVLGKDQSLKSPVSEIKKNDYVLTLNGNEQIYSKVKENKKYENVVAFYTFELMIDKNNRAFFKYAHQVQKGDLIRTINGIGEVVEIKKEVKKSCYKLVVEQGSVLANDILVGAIYFKESENRKQFDKILETAKIPVDTVN